MTGQLNWYRCGETHHVAGLFTAPSPSWGGLGWGSVCPIFRMRENTPS